MKKLLALLLTFIFVLSLASCGAGENGDKLPNKTAEELVAEGNYLDAYRVLLAKGDKNSNIKLDDFIFLPKKTIETNYRGNKATYVFTWDSEGKPLKAAASNGSVSYEIIYTYGENTYYYSRDGVIGEKFTLNEAGQVVHLDYYRTDGEINTTEYTYDEKGNLIREVKTIPGNDYPSDYTYTYDENGRLIKVKHGYGHSYDEESYTYDEAGRLVKETTTYSYDDDFGEVIYTYNDKGQLIKKVHEYTDDGVKETTSVTTYTYNENGNPATMFIEYYDGETYLYEWTYDRYGNLTKEVMTNTYKNGDKRVTTIEHEEYTAFYVPKLHAVMDEVLYSYQPDLD